MIKWLKPHSIRTNCLHFISLNRIFSCRSSFQLFSFLFFNCSCLTKLLFCHCILFIDSSESAVDYLCLMISLLQLYCSTFIRECFKYELVLKEIGPLGYIVHEACRYFTLTDFKMLDLKTNFLSRKVGNLENCAGGLIEHENWFLAHTISFGGALLTWLKQLTEIDPSKESKPAIIKVFCP